MSKKIAALIVAGGTGERFGNETPKQYMPLLGGPVIGWSLEAFTNYERLVVIHPDHEALFKKAAPGVKYVTGGDTRQQSVQKGLAALRATKPDIVLIHDAARPLITTELINRLCAAANVSGAAVPALAVTDTVKRNGKTESRENLVTVQTPQAFKYELIDRLHQKYAAQSLTDDAALCEQEGITVTLVPGQADNLKITQADDLARAEQYLAARCGDWRTGQGYDVHKLIPAAGRKLMICGVAVPHDFALEGHSDADVGLHAITDALLATIAAGDIGQHFSPKDDRWKNADSAAFLRHAAVLVTSRGGIIMHADVTLICEAPKIGPHRENMRRRVAEILCLSPERISVKATTTEGLGFTGRREGIAAQSIVTVRLPFTVPAAQQEDHKKWA